MVGVTLVALDGNAATKVTPTTTRAEVIHGPILKPPSLPRLADSRSFNIVTIGGMPKRQAGTEPFGERLDLLQRAGHGVRALKMDAVGLRGLKIPEPFFGRLQNGLRHRGIPFPTSESHHRERLVW